MSRPADKPVNPVDSLVLASMVDIQPAIYMGPLLRLLQMIATYDALHSSYDALLKGSGEGTWHARSTQAVAGSIFICCAIKTPPFLLTTLSMIMFQTKTSVSYISAKAGPRCSMRSPATMDRRLRRKAFSEARRTK